MHLHSLGPPHDNAVLLANEEEKSDDVANVDMEDGRREGAKTVLSIGRDDGGAVEH